MIRIRRYFEAVFISVALLSSCSVYAADRESLIKSSVQDRAPASTTDQPPPPTATQTAPATTDTQPPPPTTIQGGSHSDNLPDLLISEYTLKPKPPSQKAVVNVRISVYNQGGAKAGPFTVEWWPGDKYPEPGCTWRVEGLVANGGRILQCSGYVYPSWYGQVNTGVYVDSGREVQEANKQNNKLYKKTPVTQ